MAIIILLICFIAIFLNTGIIAKGPGKKELLICTVIIFSLFIIGITELLSAFSLITLPYILLLWSVVTLLNILYLYNKKAAAVIFAASLKQRIRYIFSVLTLFEKFLLVAVFTLFILIFIQGIVYPPNNWDSMCYHMARIVNWVSHGAVAHYPSHTIRQIYQPPFAEYAIMNFDILNRGDYFSASVQFFFFIFSLIAIVSIVKLLGLNRWYQITALVLAAAIPEVILQASSTQNDIVVCFFILTSCLFAIKAIIEGTFINFLFLGFSVGIAILTKGTAYLYLAPILLIFGIMVLVRLFSTKKLSWLWYSVIIIFIAAGINAPQYYRNYKLSNNIFGADKTEIASYSNERMSPLLFLSSVVKNAGLHIGVMGANRIAIYADKAIYKLHALAGVRINSPENNFGRTKFSTPVFNAVAHEDTAPNFIHLALILIAIILIGLHSFRNKQKLLVKLLFLAIFLQGALFCFYLKWQPWNTRLQVPLFMIAVVLVVYAASINSRFKKLLTIIMPVILLYGLAIILHNNTRPFINSTWSVLDNRYQKYFTNRPELYPEYREITGDIQKMNYKNIGLIVANGDWEYPLFTQCFSVNINPVSLNVIDITRSIKIDSNHINCIVSTTINKPFIEFKGKRFLNQDIKNRYIHLYE